MIVKLTNLYRCKNIKWINLSNRCQRSLDDQIPVYGIFYTKNRPSSFIQHISSHFTLNTFCTPFEHFLYTYEHFSVHFFIHLLKAQKIRDFPNRSRAGLYPSISLSFLDNFNNTSTLYLPTWTRTHCYLSPGYILASSSAESKEKKKTGKEKHTGDRLDQK